MQFLIYSSTVALSISGMPKPHNFYLLVPSITLISMFLILLLLTNSLHFAIKTANSIFFRHRGLDLLWNPVCYFLHRCRLYFSKLIVFLENYINRLSSIVEVSHFVHILVTNTSISLFFFTWVLLTLFHCLTETLQANV